MLRRIPTACEGALVATAADRAGRTVALRWNEDLAAPNRGWVTHEMSAWRDGSRVGYLRVSTIPAALVKAYHPTVFHTMASVKGLALPGLFAAHNGPALPLDSLDAATLLAIGRQVARALGAPLPITRGRSLESLPPPPPDALLLLGPMDDTPLVDVPAPTRPLSLPALEKAMQPYGIDAWYAEQRAFFAFHVDRPMVDYVRTEASPTQGLSSSHKGEGLGLLLYGATAHHLASMGMRLHASGVQREDAHRMWRLFASKGWARADGDRIVLDPTPDNHPGRILSVCPSTQTVSC